MLKRQHRYLIAAMLLLPGLVQAAPSVRQNAAMVRQALRQKGVRPDAKSSHTVQLASGASGIVEFTGWGANYSPTTAAYDTTLRSRVEVHTGDPRALPAHIAGRKAPVSRTFTLDPLTKELTYAGTTSIRHANNGSTDFRRGQDGKSSTVERVFRAVDQNGRPIVVRGVQERDARGRFKKMRFAEYWPVTESNEFGIWSLDYKPTGKLRVVTVAEASQRQDAF